MAEVGHQLVRMVWQMILIVGVSACIIFILLQKIENMTNKYITVGYHPVCDRHAYANRWGKTDGTQQNPVLGQRVMLMMT